MYFIAYPLFFPGIYYSRVSVIRGQVISREGNGLIGIRVSVATDPQFGFTLTRGDGWYESLIHYFFDYISDLGLFQSSKVLQFFFPFVHYFRDIRHVFGIIHSHWYWMCW